MGQCASIAPSAGVPRCRICGLEATAPWSQLEHQERAQWVRQRKGMACRKCLIAKRLDRIKYEKARAEYARVKDELYPKASAGAEPLRRVRSGQAWEGTHSFSASWRPSSSLRRLMSAIEKAQQAEPGKHIGVQRKPTGYIPPHAAAALAPTSCAEGLLEAAAALDASGPAGLEAQQLQSEESLVMAGRARLAALEAEEGIERVEEVSVEETSSPEMSTQRPQIQRAQSFHCSPATGGQHEAAAGGHATEAPKAQQAVREPEPQQGLPSDDLKPPALLCEASVLSASGCHGDSAYLGEEEPSQWVCSRA